MADEADTDRDATESGLFDTEVAVIEETRQLPAVRNFEAIVARAEISPEEVVAQREKIKQVMEAVMVEGIHYGKIPGVNKPTLLKPGAELLNVTFRLAPSYHSERTFDGLHLTVVSKCVLTHIPTRLVLGEGEGLCSTRESKYAWRKGDRVCPNCGADAIKKSKFKPKDGDYAGASSEDPPGWYCFGKIGGCGMNFAATDPAIVDQSTERTENPDLPDSWNTILKMGAKRAFVAAILNVTAASDIFTQDVEDSPAAREDASAGPQEVAGGRVVHPSSWSEWKARMADLGVPEADQQAWFEEPFHSHDGTDRWARARKALVLLTELDGVEFAANARELMQTVIAQAFDGLAVPGPDWRISPGETHLPTYEEWTIEQESFSEPESSEDDIPFGAVAP